MDLSTSKILTLFYYVIDVMDENEIRVFCCNIGKHIYFVILDRVTLLCNKNLDVNTSCYEFSYLPVIL